MPQAWARRADALLAKNVDEHGRFHYERNALPEELARILRDIGDQDPRGFRNQDEELAFFLNAYNLASIAIAARLHRRSRRVRRHGLGGWWARFRFFFLSPVRVARRRRTLFGLEFLTIRRRFHDPRIHFALVCATNSCPPLRGGLYSGPTLNQELDQAARAFVRPHVGYTLDRAGNELTLNRIFRWYAKDFEAIGGALGALERWGSKDDVEYVRNHRPRVRFARYDWRLNEASAGGQLTIHAQPRGEGPGRPGRGREGDSA